jgi:hypothetical protein
MQLANWVRASSSVRGLPASEVTPPEELPLLLDAVPPLLPLLPLLLEAVPPLEPELLLAVPPLLPPLLPVAGLPPPV